jgi:hypothetical protein
MGPPQVSRRVSAVRRESPSEVGPHIGKVP